MKSRIEFFTARSRTPFQSIESCFQPAEGDLVGINGVVWRVIGRSFALDYSGTLNAEFRCNLIVEVAS